MMEEFDKMESFYHETMLRDEKEQGDEIGRLRAKHAYDDDSQLNRLEKDLHQEISLLKTTVGRNRDNLTLLKESTTQVSYLRTNSQRPNGNRVKRQPGEQLISTTIGYKPPPVDSCTKPRYCTLQHQSRKSSEEEKKKNLAESVEAPISCDDLARMGYTLDGLYPLRGKEENAAKVSINHCSFSSTHDTLKNQGEAIFSF